MARKPTRGRQMPDGRQSVGDDADAPGAHGPEAAADIPAPALAAVPGRLYHLRVTPDARTPGVQLPATPDAPIRIQVRAPPRDGRATRAALEALAETLGVAPSRLTLLSGATSRQKRVRLD